MLPTVPWYLEVLDTRKMCGMLAFKGVLNKGDRLHFLSMYLHMNFVCYIQEECCA